MTYKNFKNILITTRLEYLDEYDCPNVTEERNLFFAKDLKSCTRWDVGKLDYGFFAKNVEVLQNSQAFNFPELFEKKMLGDNDFTDRKLKRGDFNKEFKYHESNDGDYYMYFTYENEVYRLRGEEMFFEFDNLTFVFREDEIEENASEEHLEKELENYNKSILPIIRKRKLKNYI
jgi:hypothetical protein